MYAVIRVGGNQYKVSKGETLTVDHLTSNVGEILKFPALLVAKEDDVKIGKEAAAILVLAKVVKHLKGEKIHIRRFKAKSRYRRHIGFRQSLTSILIESIGIEESNKEKSTLEKPEIQKAKPRARKTSPKITK